MKITLIHPPLDDPTIPYHSMAYLAGQLVHNGFTDVVMRDINIDFVNYCLEPQNISSFYEEGEQRLREIEQLNTLNFYEQESYIALWSHKRISNDALLGAVRGMRDRESFLDYPTYLQNVDLLLKYFAYLGALSYPAEFAHFRQMSRAKFSIYHLNDLLSETLNADICRLFARFFSERLANDSVMMETDCFGISIVYDHQLTHALYLARAIKERWPDKKIIFGGTSISQLYKYLKDKTQIKRFFGLCDAIIAGEGETAICEIAALGKEFHRNGDVANMITYNEARDEVMFPQRIHYEDVKSLGRPLYTYNWDAYLSPARGINYAPTRGCYWNRCTFCDYGLNTDMPTSPWRERKIEQVVEDLHHACDTEQVKYVYFAVDVLAPAYIERLSDAIIDSGLDIRWSAEMRMEKIFSPERCRKMVKSGCVCISFGMESGNQRILELIDKGTKIDYMAETMKNFASAGAAVQLMAFTDFPTETPEEKKETFDFIETNKDYWSTGGMGAFLLTGTSMIAKDPAKFGIRLIETDDTDVARAIAYKLDTETNREVLLTEDSDASFDGDGGVFPRILGRPWAGGTDSLHTMIYYDAYGRMFFKEHPLINPAADKPMLDEEVLRSTISIPGKLSESSLDIAKILNHRAAYAEHIRKLLLVPIEPTYTNFRHWQANVDAVEKGDPALWIVAGTKSAKLDKLIYQLLSIAVEEQLTMEEMLGSFKSPIRERLLEYFKNMGQTGLLVFKDPLHPVNNRRAGMPISNVALQGESVIEQASLHAPN
ncbi:MAG: radical SAM protein [Acidobacteria bacterium]|nr:radical SAM protein [Acidobacteriota bacterium]